MVTVGKWNHWGSLPSPSSVLRVAGHSMIPPRPTPTPISTNDVPLRPGHSLFEKARGFHGVPEGRGDLLH